jgi:hypothetical protein
MEDGFPIGKGHTTGRCKCGVYHGRRRYPQPQFTGPTPLTLSEMVGDAAWMNDMRVVVRAMSPADQRPKGDDLV